MGTPWRIVPGSCLPRSCRGASPSASSLASRRPRFATSSDPSMKMRERTATPSSTAAWTEEGRHVREEAASVEPAWLRPPPEAEAGGNT
jgi:hypothetical protein